MNCNMLSIASDSTSSTFTAEFFFSSMSCSNMARKTVDLQENTQYNYSSLIIKTSLNPQLFNGTSIQIKTKPACKDFRLQKFFYQHNKYRDYFENDSQFSESLKTCIQEFSPQKNEETDINHGFTKYTTTIGFGISMVHASPCLNLTSPSPPV